MEVVVMSFWSDEMYNYLEKRQTEQIEEQNKVIEKLKAEVTSLKQSINEYVTKSNSLDEDIKNLQERLDYLEGRHI